MIATSKSQILQRLAQGQVMNDWGAIIAIECEQLNKMLEQRYLEAFNDLSFLLPFTLQLSPGETPEAQIVLNNLVFGVPRLSFEAASLSDNKATLTLDILAGTMTQMFDAPGRPPVMLQSTNLGAGLGHRLQMTVSLSVVTGLVDGRGRLAIDLTTAAGFDCKLGLAKQVELEIAQTMGARIQTLPAYRQVFTVATLDFHNDGPLSVKRFEVLTQPHPNAAKAAQEGAGAVVLFCQLRADDEPGGLPTDDGRFPYLIPDDADTQGAAAFNATVLMDDRLRKFFPIQAPGVAGRLALPNAHVLGEGETHDPLDRVTFMRVSATERSWFIEPLQAQIEAGDDTAYVLVNGSGAKVSATAPQWAAANLQRRSTGKMLANGTYQASARPAFRQNQQVVVVSNTFQHGGQNLARTSIAVEYADPVTIAPTAVTWRKGEGEITLVASAIGGASWSWSLQGDAFGTLTPAGDVAVFEPYAPKDPVPEIRLQRIRATNTSGDGQYAEATVIIVAYDGTLTVTPAYVPAVDATQPIAFKVEGNDEGVEWSIFGEGYIDPETGLFTPPEESEGKITVVMADINNRLSGYAVVELAPEAVEPPTWTELSEFSLVTTGSNKCYANGMQQVEILVTIETSTAVGQPKQPLSPTELSTLKLYDGISNSQLPFLEPDQEGLPADNHTPWAVGLLPNRFHPQTSTKAPIVTRDPEAARKRLLYLHSGKVTNTRKIYAKFTKDGGGEYDSRDKHGEVEIQSEIPPTLDRSHYYLDRERVKNIRGSDAGGKDDPFSYWTASLDYWTLTYRVAGNGPSVKFLTCEPVGPFSAVRWESEQLNEIFGSYLAYAFKPYEGQDPTPLQLRIDPWLKALAKEEKVDFQDLQSDLIPGYEPAPGDLLVSLHRVDDLTYWYDKMGDGDVLRNYRAQLNGDLKFRLRDLYGNLHQVSIGFPDPTVAGHRNIVTLRLW
ncbi:hypothetical protein [Pseudomonas putida]|uniref:hypothetical protein n=1 Tax=Pseudomonas putida TaxID=303 RepID=UPI0020C1F326|nr:hypothetical protein [Pseudomonas putida]UTL82542.1 hypothetical protein NL778_06980 [Pseudomonas putida]